MPSGWIPRAGRTVPLAATGFGMALVTVVAADYVVKDHVTTTSLWDGTSRISNWDDSASTVDFFAAGAFTGNGGILKQVEGIYWNVGSTNVPNGIDWANVDFRLIFYDDVDAFQNDPRNGSLSFTIDVPDNVDWMTPVATFNDPGDGMSYDLHRLIFNVEALGITTTAGTEQLVALTPTGDSTTVGETGMMYSTGGAGAVGFELDRWARLLLPAIGPDTLQSLGAPHDHVAYRVVLADSPCPADTDGDGLVSINDLLALLAVWGPCPHPCLQDLDGDGSVAIGDLLDTLAVWGPCDG